MSYFKITFKDEETTDSMVFEAENQQGAWNQLEAMCGEVSRKNCVIKTIDRATYCDESGMDINE